ncbi:MAG: TIGR04190 family B12-binding domain/radical SAM domain protein, partial [Thermoplasmata archaeon]|nr:TIGR04190 family B12-binding domain/radical SAM domain protein [Thermoplasmata archaeon]
MSAYDLILVHTPSVYDFRKQQLLYGPVSDVVPSTPVFEMYPIGFTSIASYLAQKGYKVRIMNLAAHMLANERFDVEKAIAKLRSKVYGVDLHWLPHAHGSMEIASLIKKHHPDSKLILGGFTATYYHEELMRNYPEVDAVFLGDSTELPILRYLEALGSNRPLDKVPNLAYRENRRFRSNRITHVVDDLDDIDIDYAWVVKSVIRSMDLTGHLPYLDWKRNPMLMVATVRGCVFDCVTCMGGSGSFKRNFNRERPAYRSPEKVLDDIRQIDYYFKGTIFIVADIQLPGKDYVMKLMSLFRKERPRNEIAFEFFTPPPTDMIREMGRSLESFNAQISPDSHDPEVRNAQGRYYANQAMEKSIRGLLDAGAGRVDVFFMIGLPKQDKGSVHDTVRYSEKLMQETGAVPFIAPLAPFLDPGSDVFNSPEAHGYKILARSLEEHRELLLRPSWKHVLNYETEWMTRDDIADATYDAGLMMNAAKQRLGIVTSEGAAIVDERIRFARQAMDSIDRAMASREPERALAALKEDLRELSESTVCDKRELDWGRRSYLWSIP